MRIPAADDFALIGGTAPRAPRGGRAKLKFDHVGRVGFGQFWAVQVKIRGEKSDRKFFGNFLGQSTDLARISLHGGDANAAKNSGSFG
jgi:hypothetical protein